MLIEGIFQRCNPKGMVDIGLWCIWHYAASTDVCLRAVLAESYHIFQATVTEQNEHVFDIGLFY